MRYLGLFSVMTALFLMVGCGSKNVDAKSGVESTTEEPAAQYQSDVNDVPNDNDIAAVDSKGDNFSHLDQGKDLVDDIGNNDVDTYSNANSSNSSNDNESTDESTDSYATSNDSSDSDDANSSTQGLELSSPASIYFDFNKYDIRSDMRDYIVANAKYIKDNGVKKLVLQGNTDQIGGDEYNLALGQKRALSVRDALVLQGISKNVFQVVSFGSSKPVCTENTAECRAKNRRTDIVEKN